MIARREPSCSSRGEDLRHPLIGALYDARALHILRRGIAARDQPGVRFNGWGLDYGCDVDLVNTVKAPKGLFEVSSNDDGTGIVRRGAERRLPVDPQGDLESGRVREEATGAG